MISADVVLIEQVLFNLMEKPFCMAMPMQYPFSRTGRQESSFSS